MLVSLKEVKKYVSLDGITADEVANKLTFAGVEVEDITVLAQGTNLIIGEIIECVAHPDSDHLHVLKVNLGSKEGVHQIVCGAPNARKGLKVIVARIGAKLIGGTISPSTIRGVASDGMCCSLSELGVDSKYLNEYQLKGIEELPADAPVGEENVLGYLGLDDTVLNLKVLANRPDLLSIYNVSREIAALFERDVKIPEHTLEGNKNGDFAVGSVTVKCPQFSARSVNGIVIKESPKWMQSFLMASGTRSINNIVDIGNYVMLLTGQPIHMYDADKLPKKELVAIDTFEGDFIALDEKTYKVNKGDIVIASDNKPMCLGGVMGSLACAVDNNTKNIIIEVASFDGATIRRTSSRLGLASESSSRFVKGTNHFQSEEVLAFACELINDLCEAKDISKTVRYSNEKYEEKTISSSASQINGRLATSFTQEQIIDVLKRLYFDVKVIDNDKFVVAVPSFRLDISGYADLSEEVIRVLGFENVKAELPFEATTIGGYTLEQNRLRQLRNYLVDLGLDECLTYSLLSEKEVNLFNLIKKEEPYKILNPLTDDKEYFRTSVAHSLLKASSYNVARQARSLALFETSNVISKSSRKDVLSIVLTGEARNRGLMETRQYDFYDMKGIIENIFALFGIESSRYSFKPSTLVGEDLHPGKSAEIVFQGQMIGRFGELHPNQYKFYDLGKNNTVVLEMDLTSLLTAKVSQLKMSEISKFPFISHDLALIVNKTVSSADIIKTIKVTGKGLVSSADVFDVYEGENVPSDKKSIAISITYTSKDHTLTDKEITDIEDKIKFELSKVYSSELRK